MFDENTNASPEDGPFVYPDQEQMWVEYGYIGADSKDTRESAARGFQSANPNVAHKRETDALAKLAKSVWARMSNLNSAYFAADVLETVLSNEPIARAHWAIRAAGVLVGLMGVLLLLPLPFVIGAGVIESLSIERVIEEPMWALLYGCAPFGAVIACHGLRDALKTDRSRRRFDLLIFVGTLVAFGAWCWAFGPTFLIDVLSDPSAAASAVSLASFYQIHLALEILGASSAYITTIHMLTSGARTVSRISEARSVLKVAIIEESETYLQIARARDAVAAKSETYTSAQMAYQDHAVLKAEVAKKLLAATSASESAQALTALREALIPSAHGDNNA